MILILLRNQLTHHLSSPNDAGSYMFIEYIDTAAAWYRKFQCHNLSKSVHKCFLFLRDYCLNIDTLCVFKILAAVWTKLCRFENWSILFARVQIDLTWTIFFERIFHWLSQQCNQFFEGGKTFKQIVVPISILNKFWWPLLFAFAFTCVQ